MTFLRLLVLVAFLVAGLVVGSLNPARIVLYFGVAEVSRLAAFIAEVRAYR